MGHLLFALVAEPEITKGASYNSVFSTAQTPLHVYTDTARPTHSLTAASIYVPGFGETRVLPRLVGYCGVVLQECTFPRNLSQVRSAEQAH